MTESCFDIQRVRCAFINQEKAALSFPWFLAVCIPSILGKTIQGVLPKIVKGNEF